MDDLILRQAAIDALTKDKKALEHIINEMSGHEKEFDRLVGQRSQVEYDIYAIEQLPPAQPKIIDGRLFVTVDDIKKVGCVLVDEHKSNFCRQFWMDGDGPEPCEDAVSRAWLLAEYDRQHQGPPGGARKIIETAPPVTLKQRTGKCMWCERLKERNLRIEYYWIDEEGCTASFSEPHIVATGIANFCPNCGAKMEPYKKE